ncbi:hypothetical protein [Amycolatopsis sp.]|uniref:hypothetical protein n=1 Tax=Amycolatopsis sp. TaxID=37632 RepID=UPI00260CE068|nr:hypothetical protein [Amycolatopsis sp.]
MATVEYSRDDTVDSGPHLDRVATGALQQQHRVAGLGRCARSGCGHRIGQAFSSVERVVPRTGTLDGIFTDREAVTVRLANRAAKFTVIVAAITYD